ncbi:hypothetical protein NHP190012_14550 [Helicobacter sp. NHP19-012]|uniref:Uncharacterized protein n=1 Tax=Helicobacter gastrofelis TaxID=2849642 RepID=A0ABM7SFY1_9HELI|nr:hypothetical protein [Helicobacter sp. NHP19-012]BCZ19813.1 hypothetical protein NHP190012_14550 [Helicobacter sp. NHP19-012]
MDLLIRQLKHEDLQEFQQLVAKFGATLTILPDIKTSPQPSVLQRLSDEPVEINMPFVDGAYLATLNKDKKPAFNHCGHGHNPINTQRHRHDHHKLGCGRTNHAQNFSDRPSHHSDKDLDSGFWMDI